MSRASRVAFSGASGTGKTTLTNLVAEAYGHSICPVGSRTVARAMGFASPYDVDAAGRRDEFQRRLLAEKAEWESANEEFVTDRTVADNLAYLALHDVRAVDPPLLDFVRRGLRRYELIFFCPVSAFCAPGDDPSRVPSLAYQFVYEATLYGLLKRLASDARVVVLGSGDREDRRHTVLALTRGSVPPAPPSARSRW